jgi:TolB-like protein
MKWLILTLILLAVCPFAFAADEAPPCSSSMDVITFTTSGYEMVGDIVAEDEESLTVIPEKGGRVTLRRETIKEIQHNSREPEYLSTEKFVDGFTGCVLNLVGGEKSFRIVKVTPQSIYINLGSKAGLERGVEMGVHREGGEIVDPETKQVLGREKKLIGIIQLIGVEEDFSHAVPVDVSIEEFQEGDTGILMGESPTVAVAGITTLDGGESPYGSFVTDQLIGKLHGNPELNVIEHRQLGLRLLDQIRGVKADAILVGTVTRVKDGASINLRMVDTSSAAVLHSARKVIRDPEKPVRPASQQKKKAEKKKSASRKKAASKKSGREPDIFDRILRAVYER